MAFEISPNTEQAQTTKPLPTFFAQALDLFTLCGFAFTQPLLVALINRSVYLHDEQISWPEIAVLLVVLTLVVPIIAICLNFVCQRLSARFGGRGRLAVFAVLFALITLSFVRPYLAFGGPQFADGWLIGFAAAIPCSWIGTWLYDSKVWFRTWLRFAAVGLIIFPAAFVSRFHTIHQSAKQLEQGAPIENPVPVIMVVLDEFSGISLLNEDMMVDSARFPNFGRLAQCSTWYRNATTVHPRTDTAVPTILCGRFPKTDLSPLEVEYPGNLFQLIASTKKFEMVVFEPLTRLCPQSVRYRPLPRRTFAEKSLEFIYTLATVYPRLILTRDTPVGFPEIPRPWFGVSRSGTAVEPNAGQRDVGMFNYVGDMNRAAQFQHFLDCVHDAETPRFCFFHTIAPHYPWCFLPSGEQYLAEESAPRIPAGAGGELGEDWLPDQATVLRNQYRYRLQLGFIDNMIGQMLDRLEQSGLIDRCLLIVTADHGVSYRPGHSRRLPDAETLPDILSVPLFIKYPGRKEPSIDDRNVESVDILPTIAETLGIELPEPVDGIPISKEVRRPRKSYYFESSMTVVEPTLPQRAAALQRQVAAFGNLPLDQPPAAISSHPDWHGRSIKSFTVAESTVPFTLIDSLKVRQKNSASKFRFVKNFIEGCVETTDVARSSADLVVAVNGIVVDSGRTFPIDRTTLGFEFLLSNEVDPTDSRKVEIYLVEGTTEVSLKRLENVSDGTRPYLDW